MEVDGSLIPAPNSGYGTLGYRPHGSSRLTPTGLSPSTAGRFRPLQLRRGGALAGPNNTTSPTGFPAGFGLGSPLFGRPYSGDPYWFLFLPLLRCFRSGGSRSLFGSTVGAYHPYSGRSHSGIPGSTAACASPGLIAACRALLRRPSRAIHQAASACRAYSGSASVWRWAYAW